MDLILKLIKVPSKILLRWPDQDIMNLNIDWCLENVQDEVCHVVSLNNFNWQSAGQEAILQLVCKTISEKREK
jgi:hypothetical protein